MKELKYNKAKSIIDLINNSEKKLLIINHLHYLNSNEFIKLKQMLYENSIKGLNLKNNIFKKLFKNDFLNNSICGPTFLILVKDMSKLNDFLQLLNNFKKNLPLLIIYNKNIYDYKYFNNYLIKNKLFLSSYFESFLNYLNNFLKFKLSSFMNININFIKKIDKLKK